MYTFCINFTMSLHIMFLFVWNITMDLEDFKVNFTGNFADEGKTLMSACNIKYYNTKCLMRFTFHLN